MALVCNVSPLAYSIFTNTFTGAQTSIVQNLSYFEHLSEPMAEFLQILSEQYDYPQLVDEILKYSNQPMLLLT